jgi:PKD repeat protein
MSPRTSPLRATIALALLFTGSARAQTGPGYDINLVKDKGFFSYAQTNAKWAQYLVGDNRDVTIGDCGCFLAILSSIAEYRYGGGGSSLPLFPWKELYTEQIALGFSPRYLDMFLFGLFDPAPPPAWGYKDLPSNTCGTRPYRWALERSAIPVPIVETPSGLRFDVYDPGGEGFGVIDNNLKAGDPTVVVIDLGKASGGPTLKHAQLVVGWNQSLKRYLIVDPSWPSGPRAQTPGGYERSTYEDWVASIVEIIDVYVVHRNHNLIHRWLMVDDDPGPIELLVIAPDGRRTGFDPGAGRRVRELDSASAYRFGGWKDPLGTVAGFEPARFLDVAEPGEGTWRFVVTGMGEGTAPLTFSTVSEGAKTVLLATAAAVSPGSANKYEIRYAAAGGSSVAEVVDFTPEPRISGPARARAGEAIALDGSASFDADGTIASHLWDFADGTTATGAAASHAWAAPGVYPVRLTVADAGGLTGTATFQVTVTGPAAAPGGWVTERASTSAAGLAAGGGPSWQPSLSADGRWVAFQSAAGNLVANDSNGVEDVFVKDLATGAIERVSVSSTGEEALPGPYGRGSTLASVSADGRFVAFGSPASNLVPGDVNSYDDVFLHDRQTGTTELVSTSTSGAQADGDSMRPDVSADGRFIVFESFARSLAAGGGLRQIYVRDRDLGTTEMASVSGTGAAGAGNSSRPRISADGRFVAFESEARNLVDPPLTGFSTQIFLRDRLAGTTEVASLTASGAILQHHAFSPAISADGRFVAFHSEYFGTVDGDTNGLPDVFVRDRDARTTERVSVSTAGAEGNAASIDPDLSPDGRWVAFYSTADNLVPDDTNRGGPLPAGLDVFLHDRLTGVTERASLSTEGAQALPDVGAFNSVGAQRPAVANGGAVAFQSSATNLVAGDTNLEYDVFVRHPVISRPIADASGPYAGWAAGGSVPAHVTLDARRSSDPGGGPLTARWDFGDGTPVAQADAATPIDHAYAAAGEYDVTLVVSNGAVDSEPIRTTVRVRAAPASSARTIAIPACGDPGETVRLHSTGTPLAPAAGGWDFGAGLPTSSSAARPEVTLPATFTGPGGSREIAAAVETVSVEGGVELTTTVAAALPADLQAGSYAVSVGGATAVAFAVPCPPETELRPSAVAGGPYQGTAGTPVTFDGSTSATPGGGSLQYAWDFGDGTTGTGARPQHAYAEPGAYLVTLVVDDGARSSLPRPGDGSFARVVVAAAPPPEPPPEPTPQPASPKSSGCGCGQGGPGPLALLVAGVLLLLPHRRRASLPRVGYPRAVPRAGRRPGWSSHRSRSGRSSSIPRGPAPSR